MYQACRNDFNIGGAASEASGNFLRPRPFDRWKMPLLYKLHNLIDNEMMIFLCLIDDDHYLQDLENYRGATAPRFRRACVHCYKLLYTPAYCMHADSSTLLARPA